MNKKILIITPKFYPSIGGIEEQVKLLGEEFIILGYGVDILTYKKGREKSQEKIFGINLYTFGGFLDFFRFLRKNKNYKLIISRQYYRHSFFLGILKFLKVVKNTTVICTDSGGKNDEIHTIKKICRKFYFDNFYFFIIGQNNYLNCLNQDNINHLKTIYKGKRKYLKKIINIYNGIDVSNYSFDKRIRKIKNLLFLGRFEIEKGIFETIHAFKNIKNNSLKLHLVGYGDIAIEKKIQEIIKNDKRIVFHGKQYGEKKVKIITSMDLFLFPTYYPEGQPVTLTEIAIKNIPIISTDVANTKDIYGENILYVKKRNIGDLQEKMEWIIKNISDFSYDYSKVLKKIDIKNIAQQFIDL